MKLLVDAYNLMYSMKDEGVMSAAGHDRAEFIAVLERYARKKMIVLYLFFDGGDDVVQSSEYSPCLFIIYSGKWKTADICIKNFINERIAHQVRDTEWVLITSDRDILSYASNQKVDTLSSQHFLLCLQQVLVQKMVATRQEKCSKIYKTTKSDNHYLDELMYNTTYHLVYDAHTGEESADFERSSSRYKKSKEKKRLEKIMRKLA
ncbi:MAG: NYN domain-containing protein [Candidatus Babeliales bacterium]